MVFGFELNYAAVLTATVTSLIVGWLWYGPVFGQSWMRLTGLKKGHIEKTKREGMWKVYVVNFLSTFIMAMILSIFILLTGAQSMIEGAQIGFWIWLGFVATNSLSTVLWENKPFDLYVINTGYNLVHLVIMGAILGPWL